MIRAKYYILPILLPLFFALISSDCQAQPPCGKFFISIDGGEHTPWYKGSAANNFADDADSIAKWLESKGFKGERRSQCKDSKHPSFPYTPIQTTSRGLKDLILSYKDKLKCPPGAQCCHELFIYVRAHGDDSGFVLYTRAGNIGEVVMYSDLDDWLIELPPCVKLTIFIDSCGSGGAIYQMALSLCKKFKQCGVTIMTASDVFSKTSDGNWAENSATEDFMEGAAKDNDGDGDKGDIRDRWLEMENEWGSNNPQLFMCAGQTRMCSLENIVEKPGAPSPPPPSAPPPQIPDAEAGAEKGVKTAVPVKDEEKEKDKDKDEQYAVQTGSAPGLSEWLDYWERERNLLGLIGVLAYLDAIEKTWFYEVPTPARPPVTMDYKEAFENLRDGLLELDPLRDLEDLDWWLGIPDEKRKERIKDLERPEEPKVPDAIGPIVGPALASALVDMDIVDMEAGGTGTTTGVVCSMHNNTPQPVLAILPAGTFVAPVSGDTQTYITADNTAFLLGPAETGSMLLEPYDFMLADARQSDSGALRLVAHGDAPAQTGRQNPPAAPGVPGPTLTRQVTAYCTDINREPAPAEASVKYAIQTGPITPQQELLTELIVAANILEDIHTLGGRVLEPDALLIPPRPPKGSGTGRRKIPEKSIDLNFKLSGPLRFPGAMEFVLSSEGGTLKTDVASRDEKGEIVFSNPVGKVDVVVEPTDDPEIVRFNITKLTAQADSFDVFGKRRGDIHMALHSPEKSTGFLNISTGEVSGTVSVEAWGKKYEKPFPAAAMYTGRFDFPTRKLSLSLNALSFEPIELKPGLYQLTHPKEFWEAVHLYAIWRETNDVGKKKLRETMTEQLLSDFPEEQAKRYADMVADEIWKMVDKVEDLHEDMKDGGFDFSAFAPILKRRKT